MSNQQHKEKLGSERLSENTKVGFLRAKEKTLEKLHAAYVVLVEDETVKVSGKLVWKRRAQAMLKFPPFKMFGSAVTDDAIAMHYEYAEETALLAMTEGEVVGDKFVFLSPSDVRKVESGSTAYLQFQQMRDLVYRRGDAQTLINFEEQLIAALKDSKLCEEDVSAWMDAVWLHVEKLNSASPDGEQEMSDVKAVEKVVHFIPNIYKEAKVELSLQAKLRGINGEPTTWNDVSKALQDAEREQRATATKNSGSDDDGVPSAQVGFSDEQKQGSYERGGGGRGRGGGYKGGRGRGGGKGGKGDRKRCLVCGSQDHLAWTCPGRYNAEDEES